jgi:hypothetical protein
MSEAIAVSAYIVRKLVEKIVELFFKIKTVYYGYIYIMTQNL